MFIVLLNVLCISFKGINVLGCTRSHYLTQFVIMHCWSC